MPKLPVLFARVWSGFAATILLLHAAGHFELDDPVLIDVKVRDAAGGAG